MLDPSYIRDHIEEVRVGLRNRGLDPDKALEEIAAAFASGVRAGFERPYRQCPLDRKPPSQPISWECGSGAHSVFVPGKGLAQLGGKEAKMWEALREGATPEALAALAHKLYRLPPHAARQQAEAFRRALSP